MSDRVLALPRLARLCNQFVEDARKTGLKTEKTRRRADKLRRVLVKALNQHHYQPIRRATEGCPNPRRQKTDDDSVQLFRAMYGAVFFCRGHSVRYETPEEAISDIEGAAKCLHEESATDALGTSETERLPLLHVDVKSDVATLGNLKLALKGDQALVVDALIKSRGRRVRWGDYDITHPQRIIKQLPQEIQAVLIIEKGAGTVVDRDKVRLPDKSEATGI